jgi:hypothetical protein
LPSAEDHPSAIGFSRSLFRRYLLNLFGSKQEFGYLGIRCNRIGVGEQSSSWVHVFINIANWECVCFKPWYAPLLRARSFNDSLSIVIMPERLRMLTDGLGY